MDTIRVSGVLALKVRLENVARGGDRIIFNGKIIWKGLGNRSGLGNYAIELIDQAWNKSGARLLAKLDKVAVSGARFEVFAYRNITRDCGRWEAIRIYEMA
jgi:hypothetical protein